MHKISTKHKKSVEEILVWSDNNNREIKITIGWRWGSVFASDITNIKENAVENAVDLYSIDGVELDYLDDGWFEDIEFSEDISIEEQNRIREIWEEESYSGLEELGWFQSDAELWFSGPLDFEKMQNL